MNTNLDPNELEKFREIAAEWWSPDGKFRPLHSLNPVRLDYILQHVSLVGKTVLDIGCGGGLLSEALARQGALVTAIDPVERSIQIASEHASQSGLGIDYRCTTSETLAETAPASFDIITCMEMLEHVPNPQSILDSVYKLLKPNGYVFLSTLNRTVKAYALAIIGAEQILRLLLPGTHDFNRFIRPSELLTFSQQARLTFVDLMGIHYTPFLHRAQLTDNTDINYLMTFKK